MPMLTPRRRNPARLSGSTHRLRHHQQQCAHHHRPEPAAAAQSLGLLKPQAQGQCGECADDIRLCGASAAAAAAASVSACADDADADRRSARSAAANVAGKFDYADVNDADAHAVSELQVRVIQLNAVGHVKDNPRFPPGTRQLGSRTTYATSYSGNP